MVTHHGASHSAFGVRVRSIARPNAGTQPQNEVPRWVAQRWVAQRSVAQRWVAQCWVAQCWVAQDMICENGIVPHPAASAAQRRPSRSKSTVQTQAFSARDWAWQRARRARKALCKHRPFPRARELVLSNGTRRARNVLCKHRPFPRAIGPEQRRPCDSARRRRSSARKSTVQTQAFSARDWAWQRRPSRLKCTMQTQAFSARARELVLSNGTRRARNVLCKHSPFLARTTAPFALEMYCANTVQTQSFPRADNGTLRARNVLCKHSPFLAR